MIHEMARQLPKGVTPNAILCSVGGGGLLCGVLKGVHDLGWNQTQIITTETHGANAYHLSLLANSEHPGAHALIPEGVTLSTVASANPSNPRANLSVATLPGITSEAISLGARSPAQTAVELGLDRRHRASQDPSRYSGLIPITIPDEIAIRAALEFLDELKMLVELACAATLAHAYIPGLLSKLVPKTEASAFINTTLIDKPIAPPMATTLEQKVANDPVQSIVDPDNPMHIETPLVFAPLMSSRLGYDVYLKLDSLQPSQSFKYRGLSLYAARAVKEHGPGVHLVTASGGNAGLALAWAGKALGVRASIYLPAAAHEVKPALLAAGAEVIIGGKDYAAALDSAREYCANTEHAVLFHAYDHPTLWEGHSTLVHETARQLPKGVKPDAIVCSVGGAGLLGGVLRGVNDVGWDQSYHIRDIWVQLLPSISLG
ncbi:hypothetical protein FRC07_012548 [Ceratobasidium sp. 392]|nr:hypothetical protein FRC07_012548 [Ceratobasidium sp. 392]